MSTKTKPLCGSCEAGWLYDDDTEPVRCPCRLPGEQTPAAARQAVLETVELARPQAFAHAYRIIDQAARVNSTLSANTVRNEMELAQIPGPTVGAAFKKAVTEGLLVHDSYIPSTDPRTRHVVRTYRSRVFQPYPVGFNESGGTG